MALVVGLIVALGQVGSTKQSVAESNPTTLGTVAPIIEPVDESIVASPPEGDEYVLDPLFRTVFASVRPVHVQATCDELVPASAGRGLADAIVLPVIDEQSPRTSLPTSTPRSCARAARRSPVRGSA